MKKQMNAGKDDGIHKSKSPKSVKKGDSYKRTKKTSAGKSSMKY